MGTFYQ